jgi:hypothetical protein
LSGVSDQGSTGLWPKRRRLKLASEKALDCRRSKPVSLLKTSVECAEIKLD